MKLWEGDSLVSRISLILWNVLFLQNLLSFSWGLAIFLGLDFQSVFGKELINFFSADFTF